jgi:hypothetical protein
VVTDQIGLVGLPGGKICDERIYWHQLAVLRQVGMLPEKQLRAGGSQSSVQASRGREVAE